MLHVLAGVGVSQAAVLFIRRKFFSGLAMLLVVAAIESAAVLGVWPAGRQETPSEVLVGFMIGLGIGLGREVPARPRQETSRSGEQTRLKP
jgi:hypothetical protein